MTGTGIRIHPDNEKQIDTSDIDNCAICLSRIDQYLPPVVVGGGRKTTLFAIAAAKADHEEEQHALCSVLG